MLMRKLFACMNLSVDFDVAIAIEDHNMDNTFQEISKYNVTLSVRDTIEDDSHTFVSISDTQIQDPVRLRQK